MHHFDYKNGELYGEDVPLSQIAEEVGTPAYVYSTATLTRHYTVFADAFSDMDALVCYAVKANSNLAVIKTLCDLGAGADVVSEGELRRALAAGVPPEKIVFSGIGKTEDEMAFALETGILELNVESENELHTLSRVASRLGKVAHVAVRVNPDVDANTHAKISTGKKENKFGIDINQAQRIYRLAASLPGIEPISIAVHIGSQLTELGPYRAAFKRVADTVRLLREDGHDIRHIDLGGGLGIPYDEEEPPLPDAYATVIREEIAPLGGKILLEPGRMIVGNAGILLSRVIYMKQGEERKFMILDAAMNDLIRPAMYDGHHKVIPVRQPEAGVSHETYDIVGPVCESGDTFAKGRQMPPVGDGELVAFGTAGAYGAVMASTYNSRPLVPEVLVSGDSYAVIRPRQTMDEMIGQDRFASWQQHEERARAAASGD